MLLLLVSQAFYKDYFKRIDVFRTIENGSKRQVEEQYGWLAQLSLTTEVNYFQKVERHIFIADEETAHPTQIHYFRNAQGVKTLQVVPDCVFDGVAIISGVELDKLLAKQSVVGIELLLGEATMEQNSNDLSLLSLLQIQSVQLFEGLKVVI